MTVVKSKNENLKLEGMIYEISKKNSKKIFEELDYREKNGYTRIFIKSYQSENNEIINDKTIIYIGLEK